jgi:hypothetical protein
MFEVPGVRAAILPRLSTLATPGSLDSKKRISILHKLRQDIEKWSASLADSAVAVVFLGDNVYPEGLRDRLDPGFLGDSTRLYSQVCSRARRRERTTLEASSLPETTTGGT